MKNIVTFQPSDHGLYKSIFNDKYIPLLLEEHQVKHTLDILRPFYEWEKEDNDFFRMLVAGACRISIQHKDR